MALTAMARRPRTIVGLILTALVAVTLPLAVGIALAVNSLSAITLQSDQLKADRIAALHTLHELEKEAVLIHRLALQFEEINDPATIEMFRERLEIAKVSLGELDAIDTGAETLEWQQQFLTEAQATLAKMEGRSLTPAEAGLSADRGTRLQVVSSQLFKKGTDLIRIQVEELQREGERSRRNVLVLCIIIAPLTLIMVAVFSSLIARPIRGLLASIRRLQLGELSTPVALIGTQELVDVGSQLDDLRQRLLRLQNERSSFFRQVSHELKTPLAGVRLGTEMLDEGRVGPLNQDQREVVNALGESVSRLDELIENLLNFNGWEERHSELSVTRFELDPLLSRLVRRHELPLRRKRLQVELAASELRLDADRAKLQVCVENLFSNAVKFAPDGSRILLSARCGPTWLCVDVADEGPGVNPADQASIFEPFFQGDASRTAYEPGTGLGLCVARECARAHNGDVILRPGEPRDTQPASDPAALRFAPNPPADERFGGAYFRIQLPIFLVVHEDAIA